MHRSHFISLLLFWIIMGAGLKVFSQDFFKILEDSPKYYNQRAARFPNGDLFIGDSYLEAQRTGHGGKLFATRMDGCGNIEWSFSYESEREYMELKDVKIDEAGDIFLYGSAYIGLDELIFLLKLNGKGKILDFRLFEPETVDHFTYNIDIRNDRIMAYGLLLDFNTRKLGFIAVFNEKLNFLWGKTFTPFESIGAARFTADGGFICRSGPYHYKLDLEGGLQWALNLDPSLGARPIAGPVETAGGYIFEAFVDGYAFFYKIDRAGAMLWKSEIFPSTAMAADIEELPDGNLLAVYTAPDGDENDLCRLAFSSSGQILQQLALQVDVPIQPGTACLSAGANREVTIIGNADIFSQNHAASPDFLLRFSLENSNGECFLWETRPGILPNDNVLDFVSFDTTIQETIMRRYESAGLVSSDFQIPLREACEPASGLTVITIDTTLSCEEEWLVSLPSVDFRWEDNHWGGARALRTPGIYRARSVSCTAGLVYEYVLQKPACACKVYLPNAFSPNEDGLNDRLELYSDCAVLATQMSVYSRWGEEVFQADVPGGLWNGVYNNTIAAPGVYIVKVSYQLMTETGEIQEGSLAREVVLLR